MVMHRDDTSNPTPTMVMMKQARARIRAGMVPRKGAPNQ